MTSNALPLISVVMPSYNHAHLIGRAIDSVLSQTYSKFELIVVDNHSQDHTDAVINGFSDARIQILKIHNNGVIAASRNLGVRAAKGEWIAFLDSDDWWTPHKLAACSPWMVGQSDFIYHKLKIVRSDSRLLQRKYIKSWQLKSPVLTHLLTHGNAIATSSVVVRKHLLDAINGFDERLEIIAAEDYNAWLHIAQITDKFHFIPEILGYYFFSAQSASRKNMSTPMRLVCTPFHAKLTQYQICKLESNACYADGRFAYVNGDYVSVTRNLVHCLKWGRFDIKLKSFAMLISAGVRRLGAMSRAKP